jgi:hypothetical protein
MSDDELRLNRRRFLRHSAAMTAAAAAVATIALKTDALSQGGPAMDAFLSGTMGDGGIYPYFEP